MPGNRTDQTDVRQMNSTAEIIGRPKEEGKHGEEKWKIAMI